MAALTYNLSTQEDETEKRSILGQARMHEFQMNLGYPPRLCLKQTRKKKTLEITVGNAPINSAHSLKELSAPMACYGF